MLGFRAPDGDYVFVKPSQRQKYLDEVFNILEGWLAILFRQEGSVKQLAALSDSIVIGMSGPTHAPVNLHLPWRSSRLCGQWLGRVNQLITVSVRMMIIRKILRFNGCCTFSPKHSFLFTFHLFGSYLITSTCSRLMT